jgi:lysozyme
MQGVKHFEHFSPKAYWDGHQWSVGYGTRARFPGETIDQTEGERRLKVELGMASKQVDGIVPSATPQNVRDALTSFTYNVGSGWMSNGSAMQRAVEAGNWRAAAQAMQQYVRVNGKVVNGLVTRRRAEAEFMLMPPSKTAGTQPAGTSVSTTDPTKGQSDVANPPKAGAPAVAGDQTNEQMWA